MSAWLHQIMTATAWPMERPASYGPFHLIFFFAGLAVSIALAILLSKKGSEKTFNRVMRGVGIFLILTEIYKNLFYIFYMDYTEPPHYVWWIFTWQLCSIPMFLPVIVSFIKPGKVRDAMLDFMLAFNLMSGFVAFTEPSGLTHEYWTLTLHAFIWHMMLVFVGLYIGISGRAAKKLKHYVRAVIVFLILAVIAFLINLAFFDVSNGTINMFYVGPAISPIIVFKSIATKYGWYVNTPIYLACLCLAAFLFYLPFALVNEHKAKKAAAA